VLPQALGRSGLAERDRRFVTELVYGTTRMRRACDHLVDRFLSRPPSARVRNALRLGAYQLAFADVPPHAAVSETVAVAPKSARGLLNAVLRRVAETVAAGPVDWPDAATRLSVPDWVLARLTADLGEERARAALETMNQPAAVTERADGYVQDTASQLVAAAVGAEPGDRVLDACAAPGGKATALAATGARVVAADANPRRLGLVTANVARLTATGAPADPAPAAGTDPGTGGARKPAGADPDTGAFGPARSPATDAADLMGWAGGSTAADPARAPWQPGRVDVLAADAAHPPWRPASFDRVLVDAPCSGLGTLRRRADLRWRVEKASVRRLSRLQRRLLRASADLVRPGGTLVFSVCTLTRAESLDVDAAVADERPDLEPLDPPDGPWEPWGRGAILLPQTAGSDGMCLFRYRRSP
jgi:16S rRNA (cytosine967-C5)-methyltransferase